MSIRFTKPGRLKLALLAAGIFALAAIVAAPFLATTQVARFALAHLYPANSPSVGSATLSTNGVLVIRNLVLHDTGVLADRPLITAAEVNAAFGWRDLLAERKVERIGVADVRIYARSSASSQLSLLDLFFARKTKPNRVTLPMWVDTADIDGIIHREPLAGFVTGTFDWPLKFRMAMYGDRTNPSRRFSVGVGNEKQVADFGLSAEVEMQPTAGGTRVELRSMTARHVSLAIEADAIRQFVAKLPTELKGPIDGSVTSLSASGELDLPGAPQKSPNSKRLSARLAFAGVSLRAPGKSRTMLNLEDLSGAVKIETPIPLGPTASIAVEKLAARNAQASLDADTLRQYVAKLPAELKGPVDTSLANLSATGTLNQSGRDHCELLSGSLAFSGGRLRAPGKSHAMLNFGDLSGTVKIDTPIPIGAATSIAIDQLRLTNAMTSIDADVIRRYSNKFPTDLQGFVDFNLASLSVSGRMNSRPSAALWFIGDVNLQDLSVHSPPGGKHAIALDRLATAGRVETPIDKWAPASVKVDGGATRWTALSFGDDAVTNFDASWRIENQMLTTDHLVAQIFEGTISGAPSIELATHGTAQCDLQIKNIDVHKALANVSPERLDAVGTASGSLHLALSKQGDLSGAVDLAFDGPGTLRISQIDEVKQMLVGNFGLDMANLAVHDLEHYPFREGTIHLQSIGENSEMKIKFIRRPKSAADVISPHKEIINGQERMVGSLVVPMIDMTIPITGQSLAEILSIVSGVHPTIEAVNPKPGE